MQLEELSKLIKTRRSIRAFQDKPVPESLLLQAIEIATWAPNGSNAQDWRFFIVLNRSVINAVADTVQANMKTMMSWPEMANAVFPSPRPGTPPISLGDTLRSAAALIVVASLRSTNPMYEAMVRREKTDPQAKQMLEGLRTVASRVQSTSAAVAYLMLVLHQMGLGSVWMTGPLQSKAQIEKVLKIPADMDVVTLVPVGYPAETPTKDRKPISEVCKVIK